MYALHTKQVVFEPRHLVPLASGGILFSVGTMDRNLIDATRLFKASN